METRAEAEAMLVTGQTNTLPAHVEGNNLLRALRHEDLARIVPHLEVWEGGRDEILYEPGDDVAHVYFPCAASLASFLVPLADGRAVETVLIGREGAVGGIVSRGRLPAYARAIVQHPGRFLRLPVTALDAAKRGSPGIADLFARYADCLIAQVFQSVACNAAHTLEQRAAKWLLAAEERTGEASIPMTQEQLAAMLGVGRSYLSRVVRVLRERGAVRVSRGRIEIVDRGRLAMGACGCNALVRKHFDEVLAGVYPQEVAPTRPRLAEAVG
ncbi:Crp/Fnr family transcriptional regulator [Salinarimonas chemoclinalis]|uniref:Crp/Fnr family transcriptional regulator n=1 Tax=Salinarimonas chemoclinalis TaxID=3241599 RepID=UPI0035591F8F